MNSDTLMDISPASGSESNAPPLSDTPPEIADMPQEYTMADKLAGMDLHSLPCRIPKPTPAQAKCSHTEWTEWDDGYEDWEGDWRSDWKRAKVCIMEDIPGTNNLRCPHCGYTRRY